MHHAYVVPRENEKQPTKGIEIPLLTKEPTVHSINIYLKIIDLIKHCLCTRRTIKRESLQLTIHVARTGSRACGLRAKLLQPERNRVVICFVVDYEGHPFGSTARQRLTLPSLEAP